MEAEKKKSQNTMEVFLEDNIVRDQLTETKTCKNVYF